MLQTLNCLFIILDSRGKTVHELIRSRSRNGGLYASSVSSSLAMASYSKVDPNTALLYVSWAASNFVILVSRNWKATNLSSFVQSASILNQNTESVLVKAVRSTFRSFLTASILSFVGVRRNFPQNTSPVVVAKC